MSHSLTLGWLYPDLMSIYGDRGNIIALTKRCDWRDIEIKIKPLSLDASQKDLKQCDLLMMGGAQDSQQEIVAKDLQKKKGTLQEMIEEDIPGLYICGGFQYLGTYYKLADGTVIEQLGVLDVYTENPGQRRLIGNVAVDASEFFSKLTTLLGFENHGGRTVLGKNVKPLGKVLKGFGSNDSAKEEGAVYKNTIGTYMHGPVLPKNPQLTDWLIEKALGKKYKTSIQLKELDDRLAQKAKFFLLNRMKL